MRLVCPNCEAQYDLDDALIPAEGRDVQCSNCATTWFQGPPTGKAPADTANTQGEEKIAAAAAAIGPQSARHYP